MSTGTKDRFERVDDAIEQGRGEFDEVIDESGEAGGKAREDVREAIDDVEARIAELRNVPRNSTSCSL